MNIGKITTIISLTKEHYWNSAVLFVYVNRSMPQTCEVALGTEPPCNTEL